MPKKYWFLAGALALAWALPNSALAQQRCRVMDPTGTPLNVRTKPNGAIVAVLHNGLLVSVLDATTDTRGRAWSYIGDYGDGRPLGWVFREFIACF